MRFMEQLTNDKALQVAERNALSAVDELHSVMKALEKDSTNSSRAGSQSDHSEQLNRAIQTIALFLGSSIDSEEKLEGESDILRKKIKEIKLLISEANIKLCHWETELVTECKNLGNVIDPVHTEE